MIMVTTTRTQNRYDHRLRQLVRTTQDVSYAVQCGVPRSTARGWLSAPSVEVVTLNSLNMDATELQRQVLRLQNRIQKLVALLRVLLVVLKISRFSLNQARFPDGNYKRSLLRVIDHARSALPPRSVLRVAGLLHRVLAGTEITYSNSMIESWWRVLKHQWLYLNTLDTVNAVRNHVAFYVQEHNSRLPHSAPAWADSGREVFQHG